MSLRAGLDSAFLHEPGGGAFYAGARLDPAGLGVGARVEHRLSPSWAAFGEARAGWEWGGPIVPEWWLLGGVGARW